MSLFDLNRSFECPVCWGMEEHLRVLNCGHSVCTDCLKDIASCPTCRSPIQADFDVNRLPINYHLSSARDNVKGILDKLSNMEAKMEKQDSEIQLMKQNMEKQIQEKVGEEMDRLNKEIRELITEINRLCNELEIKEEQLKKSEESRRIMEAELAKEQKKSSELEDQLKKSQKSRRNAEAEVANLKRELEEKKKSILAKIFEWISSIFRKTSDDDMKKQA